MPQLTTGAEPTMTSSKPLQATVEDYFSDDGQGGQGVSIEPFTPGSSPGKANVRTKRSNPGDMGPDRTPTGRVPANMDGKSDSGAASSQRGPPVLPANPSPTPTQKPSRPSHSRRESTQSAQSAQSASRHPPSRRDSTTASRRDSQSSRRPPTERRPTLTTQQPPVPKRRDSRNVEECTTPGCNCGLELAEPKPRLQTRRQSLLRNQHPAESAPDVSYQHVFDTRSQISDPAQYQASSPRENRPPRYHTPQGGPVIQPAVSRRPSVSGHQPRPTSYHGDSSYLWSQPGMHGSHPNAPPEHGPPPSRSAFNAFPYGQSPMNPQYIPPFPQQGPVPAAYYQAQQMQPMRDQQRPPLQLRGQTQNPAYAYAPQSPVMQVHRSGDRNLPSARYNVNPPPPAQRQQPRIDYRNAQEEESESESESETESEEEPEPRQRPSQRRPSLRHARTTPAPQVPEIRRPQTIIVPDQRDTRPRDRNQASRPMARRTSMSRPPLVPSIKSQSAYDTPQARTIVEGSRSSRREPQVYDRIVQDRRRARQQEYTDLTRSKRSSRMYDSRATGHDYERDLRDDEEEAEPIARPLRRRRDTDTESRRRPHRPVDIRQVADAEDYINANRGERETLADQSYEVARTRSKRTSVGPSEAESSRSRGSDNNGEIRLRIGNDAPVTLSLNGDMEGRVLQLVPMEDGMNELVISGNNRGENTYRSERGSVWGERERRAIMPASQPRRDAEELTERSLHSSRMRRETRVEQDEPRRLHRSARRERRESEYRY
ncbi:hypothetical protein B5807_05356 [Epicoccum nigrum]|uniref:Uncharacterized protein n=1 Tax=Epicoccum nigrum TaxID=105696 RepID=A0A1Y2M0Y3_EPING|nr:hypothetical protein B5807_05356 [Epicoccum nigrum]